MEVIQTADAFKALIEDIKSSITNDTSLAETNLFMALIHLTENNQLSLTRWIEEKKDETLKMFAKSDD